MATPFEKIYTRAVLKFTDFGFKDMITDFREALLQQYLLSSIADFQYSAPSVKDYDLEEETFLSDLTDVEIEILALGISVYWLGRKMLNSDHLSPQFTNADMKFYSPANLLNSLKDIHTTIKRDYEGKIRAYSYRGADIAGLKPGQGG